MDGPSEKGVEEIKGGTGGDVRNEAKRFGSGGSRWSYTSFGATTTDLSRPVTFARQADFGQAAVGGDAQMEGLKATDVPRRLSSYV